MELLQNELEALREQIRGESGPTGLPAAASNAGIAGDFPLLIGSCSDFIGLQSLLHNFLSKEFSAIESNIFLIKNKKLIPVSESETTITLNKTIKSMEEEGITDWALSQHKTIVVPHVHESMDDLPLFIIITPLVFGNELKGLIAAKTSIDIRNSDKQQSLVIYAAYTAIVISHISDRKETVQSVRRLKFMREKLFYSSSMASLGEVALSVVNETENPLQIVKANTGMIEAGLGDTKRRFGIIYEQIDLISGINSSLVKFALETPEAILQSPVSTAALLDELLMFITIQLQKDGIRVVKQYEAGKNILVNVVRRQIGQALLGIMLYTRQSMPDGGQLTVYSGITRENNALISITDNGIGIAEGLPDENDYYKSGKMPDYNNIRLSIANDMIEANGGELTMISDQGKGTTFRIVLPVFSGEIVNKQESRDGSH